MGFGASAVCDDIIVFTKVVVEISKLFGWNWCLRMQFFCLSAAIALSCFLFIIWCFFSETFWVGGSLLLGSRPTHLRMWGKIQWNQSRNTEKSLKSACLIHHEGHIFWREADLSQVCFPNNLFLHFNIFALIISESLISCCLSKINRGQRTANLSSLIF